MTFEKLGIATGFFMIAMFGYVLWNSVQDLRNLPDTPTEMSPQTIARALEHNSPLWVRTPVPVELDCSTDLAPEGDTAYHPVVGAMGLVVAFRGEPCASPLQLMGIVSNKTPHVLPAGTSVVWQGDGPDEAWIGIIAMPPLMLLGVAVVRYYWGAMRRGDHTAQIAMDAILGKGDE